MTIVEVVFLGLCALVPIPSGDDKGLHALLVDTTGAGHTGHTGHNCERHTPFLAFDGETLVRFDGGIAIERFTDSLEDIRYIKLNEVKISIPGAIAIQPTSNGNPTNHIPSSGEERHRYWIQEMSKMNFEYSGSVIDVSKINSDAFDMGEHVVSKMSLPFTSFEALRIGRAKPSSANNLGGYLAWDFVPIPTIPHRQALADRAIARVHFNGSNVEIKIEIGGVPRTLTLTPRPGEDKIRIYYGNTIFDTESCTYGAAEIHHFREYYRLAGLVKDSPAFGKAPVPYLPPPPPPAPPVSGTDAFCPLVRFNGP